MSTPGRPLAEVWDHFTRSPHKKGFREKCKYCSTELMDHTGELQRHLGLKCSDVPGPIKEGANRELEEARASLKRPQVKPEESPPGVPFTPVFSELFFRMPFDFTSTLLAVVRREFCVNSPLLTLCPSFFYWR